MGASPTGEFVEFAFADESVSPEQLAAGYQVVYAGDTAGEQQFLTALGGQATDPVKGLAAAPSEDTGAAGTTVATGDDAPYAGYTGYTGDTGNSEDGIGVAGYALGLAAVAVAVPVAGGAMMLGSAAIVAMPRTPGSGARGESYQVIEGATVGGRQVAASSDTLARLGTWLQAKFSSPEEAATTIAQQVVATGPAGQALAAAVGAVVSAAWAWHWNQKAEGAKQADLARSNVESRDPESRCDRIVRKGQVFNAQLLRLFLNLNPESDPGFSPLGDKARSLATQRPSNDPDYYLPVVGLCARRGVVYADTPAIFSTGENLIVSVDGDSDESVRVQRVGIRSASDGTLNSVTEIRPGRTMRFSAPERNSTGMLTFWTPTNRQVTAVVVLMPEWN